MANPQIENGYTKLSNEILENLCRIRIPGEARQVLDVIIRKTYGFNKKEDNIALSQFCEMTKLRKPDVCRSLAKLLTMNMVTISKKANDGKSITTYGLNKNYEKWVGVAKKLRGVSKKANNHLQKSKYSLAKKRHTKETTKEKKETITKERGEHSSREINGIIKSFEVIDAKNKTYYNNKTQRASANFLFEEYGMEQVMKVIAILPKTNNMDFCPVITSPSDLKEKWQRLATSLQKVKNKQPIIL